MVIGYRRMSGAIGVTEEEKGTRGLWWEKRKLLIDYFWQQGHSVFYLSKPTKQSQLALTKEADKISECDVLVIEFGSSNFQFYGKDLLETEAMVNDFKGDIVFLCDDPDLNYRWSTVSREKQKQFHFFANAKFKQPFGTMPFTVPIYDMPISSLAQPLPPTDAVSSNHAVYIGRPNGREKIFQNLMVNKVPFKVYGRKEEWADLGIRTFDAPNQPERAFFYSSQLASLVVSDSKHKELGWRTGRAYHAVMAGCPAIVEHAHTALHEFLTFRDVDELKEIIQKLKHPADRKAVVKKQQEYVLSEREILVKSFKKVGI